MLCDDRQAARIVKLLHSGINQEVHARFDCLACAWVCEDCLRVRLRMVGDVVRAADGEVHNVNDVEMTKNSNEVVCVMGMEENATGPIFICARVALWPLLMFAVARVAGAL